jgi:hypothetical protein
MAMTDDDRQTVERLIARFEMSYSERFEADSERLCQATGFLAPGKSEPLEMYSDGWEERRKQAWEKWSAEQSAATKDALRRLLTEVDGKRRPVTLRPGAPPSFHDPDGALEDARLRQENAELGGLVPIQELELAAKDAQIDIRDNLLRIERELTYQQEQQIAALTQERDELRERIERPISDRLLLNEYGRRCFNAGCDTLRAQVTTLREGLAEWLDADYARQRLLVCKVKGPALVTLREKSDRLPKVVRKARALLTQTAPPTEDR